MKVLLIFILGLCAGSFVNALVWRIKHKRDWIKERSECTHCHHKLSALDMIPVISWLGLRGKCRYCHKQISIQYPLVELLTAVLFAVSYLAWPHDLINVEVYLGFAVWLVTVVGLVAISIYDLRWMIVPDKIIYFLIGLNGAYLVASILLWGGGVEMLKDHMIAFAITGGLFYGIFQLSKGSWIGGGDVKIAFLMGIALGARDAFLALYVASVTGAIVAGAMLLAHKLNRKARIPFGPFLMLGIVVAQLAGEHIYSWYVSLLG